MPPSCSISRILLSGCPKTEIHPIALEAPQVEENTCEAIRPTEKGNLNGNIACRKRGEPGNCLPVSSPRSLDGMGKAGLLEV